MHGERGNSARNTVIIPRLYLGYVFSPNFTTYSPKTMYIFDCQSIICAKLRNNAASSSGRSLRFLHLAPPTLGTEPSVHSPNVHRTFAPSEYVRSYIRSQHLPCRDYV